MLCVTVRLSNKRIHFFMPDHQSATALDVVP
jgi:hypothetical protein